MSSVETLPTTQTTSVLSLLVTLPQGTYLFDDLCAAIGEHVEADVAFILHRAEEAGYIRVAPVPTLDSDGEPDGDLLVRIDPSTLLAMGVTLPGARGSALGLEPLAREVVVPTLA